MRSTRVSEILSAVTDQRAEDSLPQRLCEQCRNAVPVTGVGMALMTSAGHQGVVAATDGPAARMEELQFTFGEGPCLDASASGRPVLQAEVEHGGTARWPGFGPEVLSAGIAAIFAFPLQVGGVRLGVLDLYRETPGGLDDAELAEALAFADAATMVLLQLQDETPPGEGLHPELTDPAGADVTGGRPQIHQATGMVAVQAAVGLTEALLLLRAHAYTRSRPLAEVAHDVVARRFRFAPLDDDDE